MFNLLHPVKKHLSDFSLFNVLLLQSHSIALKYITNLTISQSIRYQIFQCLRFYAADHSSTKKLFIE